MKKEYNIKDNVWIHLGEKKLVPGRVVEIIDLAHLNEGHSSESELYIIEIKTGIDDVYEVRTFEQISPDATGPIGMYRNMNQEFVRGKRYLKKIGVEFPESTNNLDLDDLPDPTPEQIHAAMDRAQEVAQHKPLLPKKENKRKYYRKKPVKA
jgi:hypothetical protein